MGQEAEQEGPRRMAEGGPGSWSWWQEEPMVGEDATGSDWSVRESSSSGHLQTEDAHLEGLDVARSMAVRKMW